MTYIPSNSPFEEWSPAQLAYVLGYRIDLRNQGMRGRDAYLIVPGGRAHVTGHTRAWQSMSRLAAWKGIDASNPPLEHPRALVDGREQA